MNTCEIKQNATTSDGLLSLAPYGVGLFSLDIIGKICYTLSMKQELNNRQTEIAIAIREIVKIPDNESWGAFNDFTRAIATMIEGAETLTQPIEMNKRFGRAWKSGAQIWSIENRRIVQDCLGGEEKYNEVRTHPNGNKTIRRILSRIKEVYGDLTPGMTVDVDVGDILVDELGEPEE